MNIAHTHVLLVLKNNVGLSLSWSHSRLWSVLSTLCRPSTRDLSRENCQTPDRFMHVSDRLILKGIFEAEPGSLQVSLSRLMNILPVRAHRLVEHAQCKCAFWLFGSVVFQCHVPKIIHWWYCSLSYHGGEINTEAMIHCTLRHSHSLTFGLRKKVMGDSSTMNFNQPRWVVHVPSDYQSHSVSPSQPTPWTSNDHFSGVFIRDDDESSFAPCYPSRTRNRKTFDGKAPAGLSSDTRSVSGQSIVDSYFKYETEH